MIKPYVITQAQVKTYLGITDTTYDTQIDLYLPVVTDDLTRKNGICNQSFLYDTTCTADTTDTLTDVALSSYEWDRLYEGASILVDGNENSILSFNEDAQEITLVSASRS